MSAALARAARLCAGALRFAAVSALGFAGLLVLSVCAASFERTGDAPPAAAPASAYLDFDLAVLRGIAERSLGPASDAEHQALLALWQNRPAWRAAPASASAVRLVSPRDAWTAATSGKSRFRTAARGALDALPFLLGGLLLSLVAAALAGALAEAARAAKRSRRSRKAALGAGALVLVALPLFFMLDAGVFFDRTRSLGLGLSAALFVAAFAGTLPGAASRALFSGAPPARQLSSLGRKPALLFAARLSAIEATEWLLPLVPALAAAAVFVCAKADQDPQIASAKSGLGALIRAAMREPSAAERIGSAALVAGALALLWILGTSFVRETRCALGGGEVRR